MIFIDPREPLNAHESKLMHQLIQQAEKKEQKKIPKKENANQLEAPYTIGIDQFMLQYSLRKSEKNHRWWVVDEPLGFGSRKTKVKCLPYYYEKDSITNDYQVHKAEVDLVLKVMRASFQFPWNLVKEAGMQEYERLKLIDSNAEIICDEEKKRLYLISTKAPGVRLDIYLSEHPHLTLQERLRLIILLQIQIQRLHEKYHLAHLDMKLENIFYDEVSDSMTLIDYGSSQNIDMLLSPEKSHLHLTTPYFDPIHHDESMANLVDYYIAAGVFGLILCEWDNPSESWYQKPLMAIKNQHAIMGRYIITKDPNCRCYAFDLLRNVNYLHTTEDKQILERIIDALKMLGHEDETLRENINQFGQRLEKLLLMTPVKPSQGGMFAHVHLIQENRIPDNRKIIRLAS